MTTMDQAISKMAQETVENLNQIVTEQDTELAQLRARLAEARTIVEDAACTDGMMPSDKFVRQAARLWLEKYPEDK